MFRVCLVGNPNCGKSTLFNLLTGSHQRVGNFTGVTVEKKSGKYKKNREIEVIDLPGLYSLNSKGKDERVVIDYLKEEKPDCIINVIDGTNLSRNLYLTLELIKLNIPMVIAINFTDELDKNGVKLYADKLEDLLELNVVKISALKNKNIDKLMGLIKRANTSNFYLGLDLYDTIDKIIGRVLKNKPLKHEKISNKIDSVLLNRFLGIPLMGLTVFIIYYVSFKAGGNLSKILNDYFDNFLIKLDNYLISINASPWLNSLLCDCTLKGICGVISYLPQILFIIIFMAILEESGYTSRMAFNLDRLFRNIGLSGKSVIPLTLSCGCIATGLSSTRNIENESERKATIILAPFMPCSAKVAVFGWFSSILFNGNALVATSMYFISIACVVVFGVILKKINIFKNDGTFILEMPFLRLPSLKNISIAIVEKTKDFLIKVGCTVFLISLVLWLLKDFGVSGYVGQNIEQSFIYLVGNALKYIFYPLGFCNWQTSVAILTSIFAKEGVIETLQIVSTSIQELFDNEYSIYAFQVFILLSPPCMASLLSAKKELNDNKIFALMIVFELSVAYIVSLSINVIGNIICNKGLILYGIVVIIILLTVFCLSKIKYSCKNCGRCSGDIRTCKKKKRNMI